VDNGTAYSGAVVTRYYDPLLEKVTAWAATPEDAITRMVRAVREYRIRGVATNLAFLQAVLEHPRFRADDYTTRFIDETPELFRSAERRDRATKLLTYIADVTVNGHPRPGAGRASRRRPRPRGPGVPRRAAPGTKQLFDELGPDGFARWLRAETRVLVTDTTMRDAHQSLLATGCAPTTSRRSPRPTPGACRGSSRSNAGAARPSTWRCASCRRTPGSASPSSGSARPTSSPRCSCGRQRGGLHQLPDNVVRHFVREAARAAWTCSGCSTA
jgi:pyruvate carboxylase